MSEEITTRNLSGIKDREGEQYLLFVYSDSKWLEVRDITEQYFVGQKEKNGKKGKKPRVTLEMEIKTIYNLVLGRF